MAETDRQIDRQAFRERERERERERSWILTMGMVWIGFSTKREMG